MPRIVIILFVALLAGVLFPSCDRIRRKGHKLVDNAENRFLEKKADLRDKLIAHFDPYHPDTRFNKKRFEEFFGFAPTQKVTNIYCYADEMGIDHDYQFSFQCDSSVVDSIVNLLKLELLDQPDNSSVGLWHPFPWWDSTAIRKIRPYRYDLNQQFYRLLWYDGKQSKAYYFEYGL